LHEVDPLAVRADEDVIVAGAPATQSIGDRRLVAALVREGLPLLLVLGRGDFPNGQSDAATDIIVAPFTAAELAWRLARLGGRPPLPRGVEEFGAITLDHDLHGVIGVDGEVVALTPREFEFLAFLGRHR